ncbi:MAG: hypothetical protein RL588_2649, partial [Pseudomonadota bacterium]
MRLFGIMSRVLAGSLAFVVLAGPVAASAQARVNAPADRPPADGLTE